MNGGEAVVATMLSRGVETAFFVPGGTYVTVLDALSRAQNRIRAVPTRLESSAAFAADAYAAVKKKPACVFVSRAPGASNAAIGIHSAMQASRPVVMFLANIPTHLKGREAFQEINYQLMYEPIAKAVFDVHSFREVADVAARALDLAVSGRPGPVVVVVSKDILDGEIGEVAIPKRSASVRMGPEPAALEAAVKLINGAKRPIIVAGEMVAFESASDELTAFAEATGAGVMTAYRQQDVIANDHPAHLGQLSLNRLPFQAEALKECDLIVNVGARLDSVTSADYTMIGDHHRLIMIYPDASAFSQWRADVAMGAHAKPTLVALTAAIRKRPPPARLAWRDALHAKEVAFATPGEIKTQGDVDMAKVIESFKAMVPKESVMTSDAGTFARWVHRYYRFNHVNTNLGPMSGAMGYGLPGAIGACVADPLRPVFCWVGDGGFLMTGHEVAACVQENLPIKIIVCDNNAWGSILVHQQKRFDGKGGFGTLLQSPDFAALGRGYGIPAHTVKTTDEFPGALAAVMKHKGPAMIHILLDIRDVSPYSGSAR
jgi:acetolactate synthase-1/2/3 large subunit